MKNRFNRWISTLVLGTALVCSGFALWPEEAEAKRMGGGSSLGSRGSRSFDAPKQAPAPAAREAVAPAQKPATPAAAPAAATPSPSRGFMGAIGGFLLGGLLGGLLFGGMGGLGGGILDILLIGGLAFLAYRFFRQRRAAQQGSYTAQAAGAPYQAPYQARETVEPSFGRDAPPATGYDAPPAYGQGSAPAGVATGDAADLERGLALIQSMDPRFDERIFLEGARIAFERVQSSWSSGQMERLAPLLTPRMMEMARQQSLELQEAGQRTVVEKVRILSQELSEAWQESGEDWITVHYTAEMVDYLTDLNGKIVEGDPDTLVQVEEFWTFNRPTGSPDPNWKLSAIQQPGETARSAL